ncbi:hypothetical protein HPB50_007348 [Hyalomma asiaticum]|uniref:Uncharacterized protein n=1 Tax=Hyalomma asiaticum TaxID=266040 RepID=A0ACB7ST84_HYAAI|nr:hypothetical protein HPB50_007348 [Hyalomma asiaticum]
MLSLPKFLDSIPDLRHKIHADDITPSTTTDSNTGKQESCLQDAVDTVERYLQNVGLRCAPEKSEHLVLKVGTGGRPPSYEKPDPNVIFNKAPIPKVDSLQILGITYTRMDREQPPYRGSNGRFHNSRTFSSGQQTKGMGLRRKTC